MTKLVKYGILLLSVTFSFSVRAGWGRDENEGKSKRQINQQRALKLCTTISDEGGSSWCKRLVYDGTYFQSEALDLCDKNAGVTMAFCIEQIKDRKYEGIYLEGLKSCSKFQNFELVRRAYFDNGFGRTHTWRIHYDQKPEGCIVNLNESMPKSGERTTFELPNNTQLLVPVSFVIPSGKTCTTLKISKNQDIDCEVCANLTKDELRDDNSFSLAVMEIKDSQFTTTSDSIKINIVNHNYIKSISCQGLATPNGEDRKAVEAYFKSGGIELKFPAAAVRN